MGGKNIDNDIGKVFGCYKVIADSGTKDKYGKKIYKVQCIYVKLENKENENKFRENRFKKCNK